MTFSNFKGAAKPLDSLDIPILANRLGTGEDELRAFLEIEARSRGFDRENRPVMLFEPHVFYRNLGAGPERDKAVKDGLAYKKWVAGKYPADSYPRLVAAIAIDETAALKACSIGSSQVLVENFSSLGYATPQAMWLAFMEDEQEHVEAMVRFIFVNGIDDDLRAHRWDTVARIYNGPAHATNGYAGKMAAAYAKFARQADTVWSPTQPETTPTLSLDALKSVQRTLISLGYVEVKTADGLWGSKTRAGVLAFRADNKLPIWAGIDDQFLSALVTAPPRDAPEKPEWSGTTSVVAAPVEQTVVNPEPILIDPATNTLIPTPGPNTALPTISPLDILRVRSTLGVALTVLGAIGPFIGGGVGEIISDIIGQSDTINANTDRLVEAVNTIVAVAGMAWLWWERRAPNYRLSLFKS